MGRNISLFSGYHSQENSITNYCGLVLKLLCEENPKSFEEVLLTLSPDSNLNVGPVFEQQKKQLHNIPDLAITQNSFSIFFETKLEGWSFDVDQIERHIKGIHPDSDTKILFLLANFEETDNLENVFRDSIDKAKIKDIILQPISFEEFLNAVERVKASESFNKVMVSFREFLEREGHLPSWKYLLNVVNCSGTLEEVIKHNVYMCPNTMGVRSHQRSKYFGPYKNKCVSKIFEIRANVVIEKGLGEGEIKFNNSGENANYLIEEAKNKIKLIEWRIDENKSTDLQVFLLDNGFDTNFVKDSKGGLFGTKKYFYDIAKNPNSENSEQLAKNLMDKKWSSFGG